VEEMMNESHSPHMQDALTLRNLPHSSSTTKKKGGWKSVKYILGK